jgi:phosphatidylserine decarboxylase
MHMFIDRAGVPFIGLALVPSLVCLAAGLPIPALLLSSLGLVVALFFRDPSREPPQAPGAVVAPADGRVLFAGEAEPESAPPGTWLQISIFLSPLDVHVNRVPIGGRITRVDHVRGTFLPAYRPGAGASNERSEVWLEHAGHTIVFRQVVGALARRVVCRVTPGTAVRTGQRFGIMKFGSRMDVFLPAGATLVTARGDRVRGGETVVARLGVPAGENGTAGR